MLCPFCKNPDTRVLETRESEGDVTRRRRECLSCGKRFTTYEQAEEINLFVVKKDGRRELFDRKKLLSGLLRACEKRLSIEELEELVSDIELKLRNRSEREISSRKIGSMVLRRLAKLDGVAYLRFASVYKDFDSIESFEEELSKLKRVSKNKSGLLKKSVGG